jgi:hypothetical protein
MYHPVVNLHKNTKIAREEPSNDEGVGGFTLADLGYIPDMHMTLVAEKMLVRKRD